LVAEQTGYPRKLAETALAHALKTRLGAHISMLICSESSAG
jgi:hypothetical protein